MSEHTWGGVHPKVETRKLVKVFRKENRHGRKRASVRFGIQGDGGPATDGRGKHVRHGQGVGDPAESAVRMVGPVSEARGGGITVDRAAEESVSAGASGAGGISQPQRFTDRAGADRRLGAEGRATGAGTGFFRRGLAANPGGEERRTFCELIAARAPQGGLSIEKMCQLGGVS